MQSPEQTPIHNESHTPLVLEKTFVAIKQPRQLPITAVVYTLGSILILFVIFATLTYLSKDSLPTETLYTFKTEVAEPVAGVLKVQPQEKVAYSVERIEKRVHELVTLAQDSNTTSPETITKLTQLSNTHAHKAITQLTENTSLSAEAKIEAITPLVNVLRAEDTLLNDVDEFASSTDDIRDVQTSAGALLNSLINTFASTSPEDTVYTYLQTQLEEIGPLLQNVALGSKAQTLAFTRIANTNEAIADGNMEDAITYILKARQALVVDSYLYDTERGPIDGIPIEPGEIPEGS